MNVQVIGASHGGEESNELYHQLRHEEPARHDEEISLGHDDFSLEELLQEKLERIAILERSNQIQGKHLEKLQNRLNENDVNHKQEAYWLRLELDHKRRENDACEERMAELYNDLRSMAHDNEQLSQELQPDNSTIGGPNEAQLDTGHYSSLVADLQLKVAHYERALGAMDNQVGMVKTSCDAVVKTLKEEISDLMEDRCKMEIDLLNKMAALDDEQRQKQINYTQLLEAKDETIRTLRNEIGGGSIKSWTLTPIEDDDGSKGRLRISPGAADDLEHEVAKLRLTKKKMEATIKQERSEADGTIDRLEDTNTKLERKLETMADDLALMKMSPGSQQASNVLARISRDRDEIVAILDRVSSIWEGNDASMRGFHHIMLKLCSEEDGVGPDGDREQLLSTLESASLLHSQVKSALLLVELKLRNQLSSLKHAKVSMMWAAPSDEETAEQMRTIQNQALQALNDVESSFIQSIERLEDRALDESRALKETLRDQNEALSKLQVDHKELEDELQRYKRLQLKQESKYGANNDGGLSSNDDDDKLDDSVQSKAIEAKEFATQPDQSTVVCAIGISNSVLEQLQIEVINVVERMKDKNETIETLTQDLEESKARERVLKRELKRIIRRQQKLHQTRKRQLKETRRSNEIESQMAESRRKEANQGTVMISRSQPSTADIGEQTDGKTPRTCHIEMVNGRDRSTIANHLPTIAPLQPSPREVNNTEGMVASTAKSTPALPFENSGRD